MPVYRPYGKGGDDVLTLKAAAGAKAAFTVPEESRAVETVRSLALGRLGDSPDRIAFRERFAQTSSALRAKSVEDTAFYRHTPLVSANEVGGDPGRPAISVREFHTHGARLARDWPTGGTVLTTHDTKRSADVRARIAVLSQCPERWEEFLRQITLDADHREGGRAPDRQLAWVAWQTAIGFGFPTADRLRSALVKGAREAALHTSWTEPDEAYEKAVSDFVDAGPAGPPLHSVALFARALAPHARANALGSTLLQLTVPGVPDLYQGTEHTYLALVDPDNRSPFEEGTPDEKTALTRAALRLRSERPEVFGASGTYIPLDVVGRAAEHCVAYCRTGEVVVAVTRLSLRLERAGGWGETEVLLPEGLWGDQLTPGRRLTGGPVRAADLFGPGPVALLVRAQG